MEKFTIILLIAALATIVMGSLPESLDKITADSISNVDELWDTYKKEFEKSYEPTEDAERKAIFTDTLKRIYEHNALFDKGESSYTLGINQFADKKPDEFRTGLLIPSQESEQ